MQLVAFVAFEKE
jgi:hypothetical protein